MEKSKIISNGSENKSNGSRWFWLVCLTFLIVSLGCALIGPLQFQPQHAQATEQVESKSIVNQSLPLREVWRKSGIVIPFTSAPSMIFANEFYVGYIDLYGRNKARLSIVDALTGELHWEVLDLDSPMSLMMDQERIYVTVTWKILVYDLKSGDLVWEIEGLESHTGHEIHPFRLDENILVYTYEPFFMEDDFILSVTMAAGRHSVREETLRQELACIGICDTLDIFRQLRPRIQWCLCTRY